MTTRRLDIGGLEFGGGLEILLQASLAGMKAGEVIELTTPSRAVALELGGWARLQGHAADTPCRQPRRPEQGSEHRQAWSVQLRRGHGSRVLADPPEPTPRPQLRDDEFHTADWRTSPAPKEVDPHRGLAPLAATPECGRALFDWPLSRRDRIWAANVADLAERASAQQWDASRDIPWQAAGTVPETLERAVGQVMTFIAQNELAALYVPSAFLPQVNPGYPEVLLWLASHVHDEARHVEVFTKRALMSGNPGYALAATELSLSTLLDEKSFSGAALLLNVLGEGTFLDLLKFIEQHAPDAATAAAARFAHRDERRHVHFGIQHIRHTLRADPDSAATLVAAAEQRAAKLTSLSGLSPELAEGLTIMAAGSLRPAALSEGARAVRGLMARMERNRIRRLRAAGFNGTTALRLSDLHTPNLM